MGMLPINHIDKYTLVEVMRIWPPSIIIAVGILGVADFRVRVKTIEGEMDGDLKKYPFSLTSTTTTTIAATAIYTTTETPAGNNSDNGTNIIQQVIANLEKVNEILGKLPDWDPVNRLLPPVSSENKTWKAKDYKKSSGGKKIDSFKMIRFK